MLLIFMQVIAQGQGHGLLFQLKILFSEINIRNLVYTCTYYSFLSALKPGGGGCYVSQTLPG